MIGCNVLAEPFFLPQSAWIPVPVNWAPNIVQGKTYDTSMADGRALWNSVQAALADNQKVGEPSLSDALYDQNRFGIFCRCDNVSPP
jgi:hypothetical protein